MPLYKKIYEDLLDKINSGYYPEFTKLPTEVELAEQYNVSRLTIRQATQMLVNSGKVEKRRRRGTIVTGKKIEQEITPSIDSFEIRMNQKGLTSTTKVISFKTEKPSKECALALNIKESDLVYKLVRLRYIDQNPIVLVTSYLSVRLFPDLMEVDFTTSHLYDVLREHDKPAVNVKRKIEVVKADETIADLLEIKKNDPIFYMTCNVFSNNNVIVEYSISKYRGDMNFFVVNSMTERNKTLFHPNPDKY